MQTLKTTTQSEVPPFTKNFKTIPLKINLNKSIQRIVQDNTNYLLLIVMSVVWAMSILAYGIGAFIHAQIISFFEITLFLAILIFPILAMVGTYKIYQTILHMQKGADKLLETARILTNPALAAAEDVQMLSSAIAQELNRVKLHMRDLEDQLQGIQNGVNTEVKNLCDAGRFMQNTLEHITDRLGVERQILNKVRETVKGDSIIEGETITIRDPLPYEVRNNNTQNFIKTPPKKIYGCELNSVNIQNDIAQPTEIPYPTVPRPITENISPSVASHVHNRFDSLEKAKYDAMRDMQKVFDDSNTYPEQSFSNTDIQDDYEGDEIVETAYQQPPIPSNNYKTQSVYSTHIQKIDVEEDDRLIEDFINKRYRHIYEGLHALSIDLNQICQTFPSEELWRKYQQGERALFTEHLLTYLYDNHTSFLEKIRQKPELFQAINRFKSQFDMLYENLYDTGASQAVLTFLETCSLGQVYKVFKEI